MMQDVDRLLRKVRLYRLISSALQFAVLLLTGVLYRELIRAISAKYLIENSWMPVFLFAGILLFLVAGILFRIREHTEQRIAAELDRTFTLKERLTTWVELRNSNHPFLHALQTEAAQSLAFISPVRAARVFAGSIPLLIWILLLVSVFAALPYLPVSESVQKRLSERRRIAEESKRLDLALKQIAQMKEQDPELKKIINEFQNQLHDLQKGESEKMEAFKKLNAMQEKLLQAESKLRQGRESKLRESLKQAGDPSASKDRGITNAGEEELMNQMERMLSENESAGSENPSDGSRKLSAEQRKKMTKAMQDYQKQKGESDRAMAEMREAMENAKKGMSGEQSGVTNNSKLSDRDIERSRGGVDDGPGTTNQDIGPHTFDTSKKENGGYTEDRTRAKYEALYKGERQNVGQEPVFIDSEWDAQSDPKYVKIRTFGADSNAKSTTWSGIPLGPQDRGESIIRKERIPPSYQKIVQKYLESIQE